MKRPTILQGLTVALLGLALGGGWVAAKPGPGGISPDTLGLTDLPAGAQTPQQPTTDYDGADPGTNRKVPRSYDTAPPMIPHQVEDYLPITTRNECLNCHVNPPKAMVEAKITVVPDSHYVDREGEDRATTPGSVRSVSLRFYQCSMCHAPQADAPVLKGNTFRPAP